jgi:epoxyqueuosine reductase QueG
LTGELKKAGALLVGFADLGQAARPPQVAHLPVGVSIALPFAEPGLARQPSRPSANPGYVEAYFRSRKSVDPPVLLGVEILRAAGYEAWGCGYQIYLDRQVEKDEMDPDQFLTACFQQKTMARLAGLGWIDRMGVMVTREYGPHVWLGSIFTDAPLATTTEPLVNHRCGSCRKSQEVCPVGAIKGQGWQLGLSRADLVDIEVCQTHRRERGREAEAPMCGLCLAACPFGRNHFPSP